MVDSLFPLVQLLCVLRRTRRDICNTFFKHSSHGDYQNSLIFTQIAYIIPSTSWYEEYSKGKQQQLCQPLGVMHFYSAYTQWTPEAKPLKIQLIPQQATALLMQELYPHSTEPPEETFISDLYVHLWSQLSDNKLPKVQLFHTTSYSCNKHKPCGANHSPSFLVTRAHNSCISFWYFSRLNYFDFTESLDCRGINQSGLEFFIFRCKTSTFKMKVYKYFKIFIRHYETSRKSERKFFPGHKRTLAAFNDFYINKNEFYSKNIVPILFKV